MGWVDFYMSFGLRIRGKTEAEVIEAVAKVGPAAGAFLTRLRTTFRSTELGPLSGPEKCTLADDWEAVPGVLHDSGGVGHHGGGGGVGIGGVTSEGPAASADPPCPDDSDSEGEEGLATGLRHRPLMLVFGGTGIMINSSNGVGLDTNRTYSGGHIEYCHGALPASCFPDEAQRAFLQAVALELGVSGKVSFSLRARGSGNNSVAKRW
jgi:hypothetical protein